jgi:hypothetical protein
MEFAGKALVRPATLPGGRKAVVITGVFYTDAETQASLDDRDEMWAMRFSVTEQRRFVNDRNINVSPEDFLENLNGVQDKKNWAAKEKAE